MLKEHHHHHLKKIFKKESSPSSPSDKNNSSPNGSHISLSRIFHHHDNSSAQVDDPGKMSRTPSILSLKRHNSNLLPKTNSLEKDDKAPAKKLSRAETIAHLQQINNKNAAARAAAGPGGRGTVPNPLTNHPHHPEKIKYNPFGLNKSPSTELPKNASFYLKGGPEGERVLGNPVADPNDYLPEDLKQDFINLFDKFEIDTSTKKLGDGGSSDVRIINVINHKKTFYALKKFTLLHKETDEEFYKRAVKEYVISKKCGKSRHVVDTLAILRIQSQANLTRGWGFALEFCEGGDLFNTIIKTGWKRTSLTERYCIFKQIAYGLKFIHDQDIVHKDLKPENVLIDGNGMAKLCDFGVSDQGHEEEGNFDSPVRLSTAFVGSPPYSPPEVMKLKEVSSSDLKNWAYDPFKMDHWGLGMLLFCIVYCGVPFQAALPTDHGYRDYKFNRDRFCTNHPSFKNNNDYTKGPGSEFKWASQFQSNGAARVAWKLCDPSVSSRYDLKLLFNDPWFVGLEMCTYENDDQLVNPFIAQSNQSSKPNTRPNTRPPSRKNTLTSSSMLTVNNISHSEEIHTPVRSLLDLPSLPKALAEDKEDAASVHSNSSLTQTPLKIEKNCGCSCDNSNSNFNSNSLIFNGGNKSPSTTRVKSMLDLNSEAKPEVKEASSTNLPAVKEDDIEINQLNDKFSATDLNYSSSALEINALKDHPPPEPEFIRSSASSGKSNSSSNSSDSSTKKDPCSCQCHDDKVKLTRANSLVFDKPVLKSNSMCRMDSNGVCELGYKIRRHHHTDVSNVAGGGSLSRR